MQEANTAYVGNLTLVQLKVPKYFFKYLLPDFNFAFMIDMFLHTKTLIKQTLLNLAKVGQRLSYEK